MASDRPSDKDLQEKTQMPEKSKDIRGRIKEQWILHRRGEFMLRKYKKIICVTVIIIIVFALYTVNKNSFFP